MRTFISFTSLLIFINIGIIMCHKCGLEQIKLNPKPINITTINTKRNLIGNKINSQTYSPIKIGYDFSNLKKPNAMSDSSFTNMKLILKETREEFSKFLQVVHRNFNISHLKDEIIKVCGLNSIGKDYSNFLIENDLIIFPMFKDLGRETLAAAGPCLIGDKTYRPHGGILYINSNIKLDITNTKIYMKNIFFHEITHILIFHPYFFENLGLTKTEGSINYISSPKVLEKARKHFNCSSLQGVPLENQGEEGSIGSHWESRYMLGDYMISTNYLDVVISDITLALFEDSRFYKVNYYSGGLFKFGENKGCDFFDTKCIVNGKATFDEFCNVKDEPKCSSSRTLKSSCFIYDYESLIPYEYRYFGNSHRGGFWPADYCPVALEIFFDGTEDYFPTHCQLGTSTLSKEYGETIGKNSFCFMSSLLPESSSNEISQMAICYEVECDTNNNNIIVKLDNENIICPTEGGLIDNISGFKGSINCPKYSDICNDNGQICNEMFSCFDELSKKDNIRPSFYDSNGGSIAEIEYDDYDFYYGSDNLIKVNTNLMILLALFCLFVN